MGAELPFAAEALALLNPCRTPIATSVTARLAHAGRASISNAPGRVSVRVLED